MRNRLRRLFCRHRRLVEIDDVDYAILLGPLGTKTASIQRLAELSMLGTLLIACWIV